jgi:hypothetical protein
MFTATVLPPGNGGVVPTGGLVTFSAGGTQLATASVQSDGKAFFSSALPAGTYDITASFAGVGGATSSSPAVAVAVHARTTSSLSNVVIPPTAVASQKLNAKVPVVITSQSATKISGLFTVATGTALDDNSMLVNTTRHNLTLNDLQSKTIIAHIKSLPATIPTGSYHLVVKTTDPGGNVGVVATAQTIQVTGAFINLAGSIGFVTPSTITAGGLGSVFLTLTNSGNEDATGPLTVTLQPSSDGKTALPITLFTGSRPAIVPAGQTRTFKIRFSTTGAAKGSYVPYLTATLAGVSVKVIGVSPFSIG